MMVDETDVIERLRTLEALPPADLLERVQIGASRRRRRHRLALAVFTLVATGAAGIAFLTLNGGRSTAPTRLGASPAPSASAPAGPDSRAIASGEVTFGPPPSTFVIYHGPEDEGVPSQALLHVQLPDPAPGYPVREQRDRVDFETPIVASHDYWQATFFLASSPDRRTQNADGTITGDSTGPAARVFVVDRPLSVQPDRARRILGDPVIGITTIDGHTAYLTRGMGTRTGLPVGSIGLYFTTDRFTVYVLGSSVTDDESLGSALNGL